eukprot:CAMPEP_0184671832 /NCGR_PEP_ID=MMETSP0308-20130426/85734_1 /TAXON_ID=38269 /ORGANISM="Gloeochaete witrockiana, Strain SAG 46.84" /LENGTH=320 /DNA_ID=CAMNT_0027119033 /DNA_START=54 /DNA_END=1016 /DNA_ORIENTATION=+
MQVPKTLRFALFCIFCSTAFAASNLAVKFDGSGGVVKSTGIDLDKVSFSWELWCNVSVFPGQNHGWNDARMIWAFMHAGPCSYHQCLLFGFNSTGHAVFGFILNDMWVGPFTDDVGKFVHWAGTYDRPSGRRYLYRNGEIVGTDIASSPYWPHSKDLYIGQDNISGNKFMGAVDEIRMWRDVVLPQETIKRWMHAQDLTEHEYYPNLVAHFQFNDGPGAETMDSSKNALMGQLVGLHPQKSWVRGFPGTPVASHVDPSKVLAQVLDEADLYDLSRPMYFYSVDYFWPIAPLVPIVWGLFLLYVYFTRQKGPHKVKTVGID